MAVVAMLWLASGGVGGNTQPGALIALFVFCALAAFEALAPSPAPFSISDRIASALRITAIDRAAARSHVPGAGSRFLSRLL
jgi:ATP-binding cassette subfamily C protein CydC